MSNLEKQNLEAHVDLCAERYKRLEEKFCTLEKKLIDFQDDFVKLDEKLDKSHREILVAMSTGNNDRFKVLLGTAGTVVAGLLTVIGYVIVNSKIFVNMVK
jgi:predicted nuclease with TOPRIM domain